MEAESLHNPGEGEFGVSCTNSPKGSVPYKSPKTGVQIEKNKHKLLFLHLQLSMILKYLFC